MASSPVVAEDTALSAAAPVRLPLVPLMLAMLLAALISTVLIGGGGYLLIRSGKLPLQKAIVVTSTPAPAASPVASHVTMLEPVVANLSDAGGTAYLKMSLALRVADGAAVKANQKEEKPGKEANGAEAEVRDTVLSVVGRETSDRLLAPDGKDHLKTELKKALADRDPDLKIMDLYFTDFLVQR